MGYHSFSYELRDGRIVKSMNELAQLLNSEMPVGFLTRDIIANYFTRQRPVGGGHSVGRRVLEAFGVQRHQCAVVAK